MPEPSAWLVTARERGNAATRLDDRHAGGEAWSTGNEVRPLVHGAAYFAELLRGVARMRAGDLLLFTDWRGDPDQLLDGAGHRGRRACCAEAARRGVVVKGLVWRSHLDRLAFSAQENRHLGEEIEAAGGECLLDMRVRPGGSHHQKFVVLRHPGRPELDVAFVGGIDLCHSRRDDGEHGGDPQPQPMAAVYGDRPPWHDVQLAIRGPAVGDVEAVFRERWEDPAPLTRNPLHRLSRAPARRGPRPGPLPAAAARPAAARTDAVQLLRTYPEPAPRAIRSRRTASAAWPARYTQGARPGAFADLPRGPVPVVSSRWPPRSPKPWRPNPVGFQNSATGLDLGFYAARSYSLMRPPRTGRRLIRSWERSAAGWSGRGGRSWRLRWGRRPL